MLERAESKMGIDGSSPTKLKDIRYQTPDIAGFPSFAELPVHHGFTWGKRSQNMAYKQHVGDPSVITRRNEQVLAALGMSPLRQAVVMGPDGKRKIDDGITSEYLTTRPPSERGIFISADAVFTDIPKIPIIIKPGDCTISLIYSISQDQNPVAGIIHAGRSELASRIPADGIAHLEEKYGCDPTDIRIGIVPALKTENHLIRAEDVNKLLGETSVWDPFTYPIPNGDVHLDNSTFLVTQFTKSGVPARNIELYDIDTHAAANRGESFSHRYATETQSADRIGRFLVAIELV